VPYSSSLARPSDPETSSAAATAAEADGRIDTDEWRILQVLREMPRGGTGSEIAARISARYQRPMTNVQVMRRMADLLGNRQVHRRPDVKASHKANAHYAYLAGRGRAPRRRPGIIYLRRGGETLHWLGSGDMPLFDSTASV